MMLQVPTNIIIIYIIFCVIYYFIYFKYSSYIKNKSLFKNTENYNCKLKNINTFVEIYEEPLSYNSKKVAPIDIVESSRDWKKDLSAIKSQQEFVEDNNTLGNYINDTDLKNPELN